MSGRLIGELLVQSGAVRAADVRNALALQADSGGLLGQLLVRLGAVSEARLLQTLSQQLDLPVLQRDAAPPADAVRAFMEEIGSPPAWWADRGAVAWRIDADRVAIAAIHPLDPALVERVGQAVSSDAALHLAPRGLIESLCERLLQDGAPVVEAIDAGDAARLRELAQEAPVIDLVNGLFAEALQRRASDVHVEPFEDHFQVRMRVDGMLVSVRTGPRSNFDAVCSRLKLLSGMDIGERRLPQDGRQTIRVSGQDVDLRVSTLPCTWGESVVLRLLGKTDRLPQLSELGVGAAQQTLLHRLVEKPNGVVLVTGPTGSGKTTTIYRLLTHLDDGQRKIVTVEDPVEFDLPGVVQVHVKSDIGLTFAAGLRSILRQDPDVIMVGEIRDPETARIAVQAALTGHLVISTVHTNSALAAVSRLTDLGVEEYLLADVLRGVVGQRLVRQLCLHCATPSSEADAAEFERAGPASATTGTPSWRDPVGCARCGDLGYAGRLGLYEIAEATPTLEHCIRRRAGEQELFEAARSEGFLTMYEDGWMKAREGRITLSEVHRVAGGPPPRSAPSATAARTRVRAA